MKRRIVVLLLLVIFCCSADGFAEHHRGGVYNTLDVPVVTAAQMGCVGDGDGLLKLVEHPSLSNLEYALMHSVIDFGDIQWHVAPAGGMNSYTSPSHCLTLPVKIDGFDQFIFWTAAVAFYKDGNFYVGKWPPIRDEEDDPYNILYRCNTVNLKQGAECLASYRTEYCLQAVGDLCEVAGAPVYGTRYGSLFKAYTGPLAEKLMSALTHTDSAAKGLSLDDYYSFYSIATGGSIYFSQIVMHGDNPLWTLQNDKIGGPGWDTFASVFPAADGVIYAITESGDLIWYHNVNWNISKGSGFAAPEKWMSQFSAEYEWYNQDTYPRHVADVNGDGKADIIGFASDGVYVALSTGSGLSTMTKWLAEYGTDAEWSGQDALPRFVADVNGDGKADIVGFAYDGTYVSLSTGSSFEAPACWLSEFNAASGWLTQDTFPRYVADVNGDDKADVIGFASDGVYVSLSTGSGFASMSKWLAEYGTDAGWSGQDAMPRFAADVNGDSRADVVGFAGDGTYVSLSTGTGFATQTRWLVEYGASSEAGGWSSQNTYPRLVADVTGDKKADIVGFSYGGTWVSLSIDTAFDTPGDWQNQFDSFSGWGSQNDRPRFAADVNGDGKADIVAFAYDGVYVGLGGALWKDKKIGTGWNVYKQVFAGSEGAIYAVDNAGDLFWYQVDSWNKEPGGVSGPYKVGSGWGGFTHLSGGDDGIIYAIDSSGSLNWFKHLGYKTGEASWAASTIVGSGWGGMKFFSYAGDGQIIATDATGNLLIYKNDDYQSGGNSWSLSKNIAPHFGKFLNVFATY